MRWILLLGSLLLVNLAKAEDGLLTATGFGTADLTAVKVKAQAKMMARRAAILDAQRNLAEQVRGIKLTGGTTMQEYEISSDIVATRVKGLLMGAFETDQTVIEDEQSVTVEVTMAICVNVKPTVCEGRDTLQSVQQQISNQAQ